MPGDPHSGSKVWKAPDREISEPGEKYEYVRAPGECAGAGVGRVWTGSSQPDRSGCGSHRHAQGVRRTDGDEPRDGSAGF